MKVTKSEEYSMTLERLSPLGISVTTIEDCPVVRLTVADMAMPLVLTRGDLIEVARIIRGALASHLLPVDKEHEP